MSTVVQRYVSGGLAATPWKGTTVGELAQSMRAWDVVDGSVRPTSARAERLERFDPDLRARLEGALGYLSARPNASMPARIVLAQDDRSLAVARLMSFDEAGVVRASLTGQEVTALLDQLHRAPVDAQAASWVVLGPKVSDQLSANRGASGAQRAEAGLTFSHELEHRVATPTFDELNDRVLGPFDEGIANALSGAVPARLDFQAATGIDIQFARSPYYTTEERTVRNLLDLARIDVDSPAGLEQARSLLRGGSLAEMPARMGAAIASANGRSVQVGRQVADEIGATRWKPFAGSAPRTVDRIRSLLESA